MKETTEKTTLETLVERAERLFARLGELTEELAAQQWRDAIWIPDYEAARRLGVETQTLAIWRMKGIYGLRFSKPGRRPMYLAEDVEALLRSRIQVSTAEELPARQMSKRADVCTAPAAAEAR